MPGQHSSSTAIRFTYPGMFFPNQLLKSSAQTLPPHRPTPTRCMRLRLSPASHHAQPIPSVFTDLVKFCSVFLRDDTVRHVQPQVCQPHGAIHLDDKALRLINNGKDIGDTTNHLKPL
ncbi:hypothetical protein HPB48_020128 [Haemaphysalis longicornis]|uniref:Uncharacterized protein n=1 Tax=Haemaphysalis longicornis TaxID=44386 RepID=A0A9J6GWY1_HAELO|nr:hypothetical protein HPB48_020128 [Haemaphysalis longicornis]